MTRPIFNSQISLGNIIQLGLLLVAVVGGWFTLRAQTDMAARDVAANVVTIRDLNLRVRALETQSAGQNAQLSALQRDIGEIKDGQKEINALLRQILQHNTGR
ncbi:MAG: hypothetical protein AAF943_15760 [Pseudomonadota bacterium]